MPTLFETLGFEDFSAPAAPPPAKPATLWERTKRGVGSTVNAAQIATAGQDDVAALVAEEARSQLPASPAALQMQEDIKPYVERANQAQGAGDNIGAWSMLAAKRLGQFITNPREAAGMIAESLPNSAPGMAGMLAGGVAGSAAGPVGAAAGSIAGGTAGGYVIENGAAMRDQIMKEAQARGVDPRDPAALQPIIAEKYGEFLQAARLKGAGTAVTDAVLTRLTLGLAGMGERAIVKGADAAAAGVKAGTRTAAQGADDLARLTAQQAGRNTLPRKVARGAGITAMEMGGESFSEGAGQLLAYGKADAGDVVDEGLLGIGQGMLLAGTRGVYAKATGATETDAADMALGRLDAIVAGRTTPLTPGAAEGAARVLDAKSVEEATAQGMREVTNPQVTAERIPVADVVEETTLLPTGDAREMSDGEREVYATTLPLSVRRLDTRPLPVGEASEVIPTGDVMELPKRIPTGRATEIAPETIQADDFLTGDGMPYGTKTAASVRAKKEGLTPANVVEIPGAGWVVRPQPTTLGTSIEGRPNNTRGFAAGDVLRKETPRVEPVVSADGPVVAGAATGGRADAGRGDGDVGPVPAAGGARPLDAGLPAPAVGGAAAEPVAGRGTDGTALTTARPVMTGKVPGTSDYGASAGSLSEGNRRQLMVDPDGGYFWGDWNEAAARDGSNPVVGKHAGFTPAKFTSSAEAREAAASTPQSKNEPANAPTPQAQEAPAAQAPAPRGTGAAAPAVVPRAADGAVEAGGLTPADRQALEEKRQMVADMIATKKANREAVPDAWVKRLAEVSAQLRGETVDGDAIYANEVEGHPLFDGPPVLRNLVPIKVKSAEEAQRKLDQALDLERKVKTEFYSAQQAVKVAKTAGEKKAAQTRLSKLTNQGWDEDTLKTLRDTTITELSRLVDAAAERFATPNATPPVQAASGESPAAPEGVAPAKAPLKERLKAMGKKPADLTTRAGMVKALKALGYEAADLDAARTKIPGWGRVGVKLNTIPFKIDMVVERRLEAWKFNALESEAAQSISQQEAIDQFRADFDKLISAAPAKPAPVPQGISELPPEPARTPVSTAPATHKDPGEPAEVVTPAVVAEAIKTAAKNEDMTRGQMKAEALRLIDMAIAKAPEKAVKKITISVPGDGAFTVVNSVARLKEFRKQVETSPGFRDKLPTFPIGKAVTSANLGADGLAREMLDEGEPVNALEILDATDQPMMFGNGNGSSVPYTNAEPMKLSGADAYGKTAAGKVAAPVPVEQAAQEAPAPVAAVKTYPLAPAGTRYEETDKPITMMSPDAYLAAVRPLEIDDASRDNIDDLKAHILSGKTLDPLHIRADGKEDGRHRAVAAKELGIKQVPVVDERKAAAPGVVENFGEALPPSRRQRGAALREDLTDDEIYSKPLSEIWPAAEIDGIEDTFAASVAHAARAEIPAKPRKGYKLDRWVDGVKMLRGLAQFITGGQYTREQFIAKVPKTYAMQGFMSKVALLEAIDRANWKRIGAVTESPQAYKYVGDKKVPVPQVSIVIDDKHHWLEGSGSVADHIDAVNAILGVEQRDKKMQFEVRGSGNSYAINKKGDSEYRKLKTFTTAAEASAYRRENYADLIAAWEAVKERDNVTERDTRSDANKDRVGKDWRQGRDITGEEFDATFGFKGGEFGKWVSQGDGARERQWMLNRAFDALMDLSEIIGVPPKAISLNGTMGIAFGSRGTGRASAHFEPGNLVINLTKTNGAGALAHEWFHALDNYFARARGGEVPMSVVKTADGYRKANFITYKPEPLMVRKDGAAWGALTKKGKLEAYRKANPTAPRYAESEWMPDPKHPAGVRPEVEERFAALVDALNAAPMTKRASVIDKGKSEGYWSQIIERAARSFESYVIHRLQEKGQSNEYLANVTKFQDFARDKGRYPYPTPDEIKPVADAFAALFDTIQTRADDAGNVTMFSRNGRLGIPLPDAQAVAAKIRLALPKAPPIIVHETVDKAPAALLDDIRAAGAMNDVEAAYHAGSIHVFPQHMASVERMEFVVAHHEVRHHGLRAILGDKFGATMLAMRNSNPALKAAAQAKMDAGLAGSTVQSVDEALADMPIEELAKLTGFDKLVARIRQWLRMTAFRLRKAGFGGVADAINPKTWTDRDVAAFVLKAELVSRDGGPSVQEQGTVFTRDNPDIKENDYGNGFWRRIGQLREGLARARVPAAILGRSGRREGVYRGSQPASLATGLEPIQFRDDIGGWSDFVSLGVVGTTPAGKGMTTYVIPTDILRGSTIEQRRSDAWLQANSVLNINLYGAEGEPHVLSVQTPVRGDPAFDLAVPGTFKPTGQFDEGGVVEYQRLDIGTAAINDYLSEAVRRFALQFGFTPSVTFTRDTGANPGAKQGVVSAERIESRFSRATPAAARDEAGTRTAQDFVKTSGGVFDFNRMGETKQDRVRSVVDKARPFWLGALTRDQIADMYGKEIPQIKDYDDLTRAMENERSSMAQKAETVYEEWAALPGELNDRLARMMLDATVHQVHPDRADPPAKATDEQRAVHARVRNAYKMMPKEGQAMYAKVRDFHTATLTSLKTALEGRIDRLMENGAEKSAALTDIRARFDQYLKNGPYFPLTRFGEFLVIATREDGERVVAAYESAGEQQAAARALEADGFSVKLKAAKAYSRSRDGAAGKFIGDVLTAIDKMDLAEKGDSPAAMKEQLLDDLNQLFIRALPDLSYRKHFMHRKNTPGFSADVMRGFASSAFFSASHIARLNHSDKMTFALDDAFKAIEAAPEGDFNQASQVLNEMAARHESMLNPTAHPLSVLATQAGFVMYLGLSPAAGLINMLQVPMVALPYLGARYGFGKATMAMSKAYKDIMGAAPNRKSGFNAAQSPKLTTEERQAMSTLQDEGVIDLTQAHDLAAATDRDVGSQARSKASFAIARAMKIVGWTFHVPEVMNRQVTALMTYRMEIAKGSTAEVAMDAARDAIKRTQFDYSSSNRARYMQGNLARVVTQFKQFSQNMTYFLGRAAYQALKGEDPEVRSIARRQILSTFAVTGAMAGSLGLPGLGFFGSLIGALAGAMGDDDEPWDWKTEYRNMLADTFGKEAGEVLAKGVPRALMPWWDISNRVSLSDLWWRSNDREGQNPRESFASDMGNILGPTAGTILGWYTAADHMQRGNYSKAAESVVPKFIRDPLKAIREGTEGVTNYNGEPLLDTTTAEDIGRMFGFAPTRASEMYEARNAVMNSKTALEEKRQRLLSRIVKARMDGDREAEDDLRSDIAGFNERNPAFKITGTSIGKAVMNKRRNRENTEDGIVLPKTKDSLRDLGRFAVIE